MMAPSIIVTQDRLAEVREMAWEVAQRHEVFGYIEIAAGVGIAEKPARDIIKVWREEGRVRMRRGGANGQRKLYELTPEYRDAQPRASVVGQQCWTAMRGLRRFTPTDLVAHARPDLRMTHAEAGSYCLALMRGGYVQIVKPGDCGGQDPVYRLLINPGPRAPQDRRVTAIWDPNAGDFTYIDGVGRIAGVTRTRAAR